MCDIAEFDFGKNKKPPTEPFQNKRIRNPATARTVPSRMVCAPSFLSLQRRGMCLTASGGRSASPHPESRLLFTLCGFLRSFLSRTSVGGLAFGFTIFLGGRGKRGERGKRGGRSLLKKLRKTFIWGMGMGGVCASPFAHQYGFVRSLRRSFASGCGSIRLLRGESAGYSLLYSGSKPYHIGYGTTFTGFLSPFIRHIDDPFAVSGNSNDRP